MRRLLCLLLFVSASACRRVIDISLNNAASLYVIEGVVNDNGLCRVYVSESVGIDDTLSSNGISGLAVTISDNNGAAVKLAERSPGTYQTSVIKGRPGHTYHLQVIINNEAFTASSTMPAVVLPDSLDFSAETISGHMRYIANVWYTDPPELTNYYRFVQYVNSRKEETVFVNNDYLSNGNLISFPLFYLNPDDDDSRDIRKGDTVKVEMQCVDAAVYKYWYSLSAITNTFTLSGVTPANPVSNISGGVLGYFSAHTSHAIRVVTRP